jgi:glycerol dehydrogenase-like iron-containing ADH family enzyme
MHGIQVLIATLHLEKARSSDLLDPQSKSSGDSRLKNILIKLGFPTEFQDININATELSRILELAPKTRSGRYSILNELAFKP